MDRRPQLVQTVLDGPDARLLAEFYRQLLGYEYRPGDEPGEEAGEVAGERDGPEWLVLQDTTGRRVLAFQRVERISAPTWPAVDVPQQLHLDMAVATAEQLHAEHERVLALGGSLLYDRFDDPEEPLRVYADPAGHPFCIFVNSHIVL